MMTRFARLVYQPLFLLLASFLLDAPVLAQDMPARNPIILWVAGDLWEADANNPAAPPVQRTFDGTISRPTISPDSTMIAYRTLAPVAREALGRLQAEGAIAEFELPTDIYVYFVETGATRLVAGQPEGASLFVDGVADNARVRGAPAWSPDSTYLATVETAFGAQTASIVLTHYLDRQPYPIAVDQVSINSLNNAIHWTHGYDMDAMLVDNGTDDGGHRFDVFTLNGELQRRVVLPDPDGTTFVFSTTVQNANADAETPEDRFGYFGLLNTDGSWIRVDETADALLGTSSAVTLRSLNNADGSLQVAFVPLAEPDPVTGSTFYWEAADPLAPDAPTLAYAAMPGQVALSPDSRAIASLGYPGRGGVGIWRDGEVFPIAGTGEGGLYVGAVLWGAGVWVVN